MLTPSLIQQELSKNYLAYFALNDVDIKMKKKISLPLWNSESSKQNWPHGKQPFFEIWQWLLPTCHNGFERHRNDHMKYNDIGLEKAAPFTKNIYLVKDVIYVCVCVLYMLITYILYI